MQHVPDDTRQADVYPLSLDRAPDCRAISDGDSAPSVRISATAHPNSVCAGWLTAMRSPARHFG